MLLYMLSNFGMGDPNFHLARSTTRREQHTKQNKKQQQDRKTADKTDIFKATWKYGS